MRIGNNYQTRHTHCVGAHFGEVDPVTHLQLRELDIFTVTENIKFKEGLDTSGNNINGITSGSKEGTRSRRAVRGDNKMAIWLGVVILNVVERSIFV